jgi:hypothetical protein
MARLGRGQPHGPIYLRNVLVPAVVVAALAPQIHVVRAGTVRPPARQVTYLGGAISTVPQRLGPQVTVVQTRARRPLPATHIYVLRGAVPVAAVVPPPAPQIHVVQVRGPARRGVVVSLHGAPSTVPLRLAPQVTVVQQRGARRPGRVIVLRGAPAVVATAALAPQIHVVQTQPRRPVPRVVFGHGAPSTVPLRLAPQITVVSQATIRPLCPIARRAMVVQGRGAPSTVPLRLAPQITVIEQQTAPRRRGGVVFLRGSPVAVAAPVPTVQSHVILARRRWPAPATRIVVLRGAPSVVPARLAPQITTVLWRRGAPRFTHVTILRGAQPAAAAAVPSAPQVHVVLVRRRTPPTVVVQLHGARSTVPGRLAPQIHVTLAVRHPGLGRVLYLRPTWWGVTPVAPSAPQFHLVQVGRRPRPTTAIIVQLRGAPPPLPAPQLHVVLARRPSAAVRIVVGRAPLVVVAAPSAAPQPIHVVLQTRRRDGSLVRDGSRIVIVGQKSVVPPRVATPQVTVLLQTRRRDQTTLERDRAQIRSQRAPLAWRIAGITRDANGNALAGCVVKLYRTVDDAVMGVTVSDAAGKYAFTLLVQPGTYYVVAYLAGSPDVAGTTVNTLTPI